MSKYIPNFYHEQILKHVVEMVGNKVIYVYLYLYIPIPIFLSYSRYKDGPIRVLTVGLPNVGKSSLLNNLRNSFAKKGFKHNTPSLPPFHTYTRPLTPN